MNLRPTLPVVATGSPGGMHLEFRSRPDFELALDRIESSGIEILATHVDQGAIVTTVYVPEGKEGHFIRKVEQYLEKDTKTGKPQNQPLVDGIESVELAMLRSFWTDPMSQYPRAGASVWWEVWLRTANDPEEMLASFHAAAAELEITTKEQSLRFPERIVTLVFGTDEQLARLVRLGWIAELRAWKEAPNEYRRLGNWEQRDWAEDLKDRLVVPALSAPAVCVLDSGVNRGHPLLEPFIAPDDVLACDPSWRGSDHKGHGTEMAGLALFGDLTPHLSSTDPVTVQNRVESVKILPPGRENDPQSYGWITQEGVSRIEVTAPDRRRAFCLAVTSELGLDRGRPSAWSGKLDQLAAGAEEGGEVQRLIVVSAGNTDEASYGGYPQSNLEQSIHDPGQAWNALTVGAYTERWAIDDPQFAGYQPLASPGELSPYSTTSDGWHDDWPIKPDIVMEGGNVARSPDGTLYDAIDDLQLLTTSRHPPARFFELTCATSAAAATAARYAAWIWSQYPQYWPETVRGLLVHGAEWKAPMRAVPDMTERLRRYGYGVPRLESSLYCARNSLTLVAQDEIQPYEQASSHARYGRINLYQLPWPTEALQSLGETEVELRVTLSYFVEPSPGQTGWKHRYRYPSHGLRFKLQRPNEGAERFRQRVNAAARDEDAPRRYPGSDGWIIGGAKDRGSLLSDRWRGTAAELALRSNLAVHPIGGWWKERRHLGQVERRARYALIVSIHSPRENVDIYTPVLNQVRVPVTVPR